MVRGLYPSQRLRPTSSKGEHLVYERLLQELPPGWACWHSLKLLTDRSDEAEGDFTFFIPGKGILLLEVKGGQVSCQDGHWKQNHHSMRQTPRQQAHRLRQLLLTKFREDCHLPAPWIEIALSIPQTAFSDEPSHGDLDGRVLGEQDLPHLGEALVELSERIFVGRAPPANDEDISDFLHALFGPTFAPALNLGDRADFEQERLVDLDYEQFALLDLIENNERVSVTGGPGTGKTFMASELRRRWARAGKKPLYLCSTDSLARKLRDLTHQDAEVEISTLRRFAVRLLEESGEDIQSGAPELEWTQQTWGELPARAALVAPRYREEYGGLIVDEAQDFTAADWTLAFALGEGRPFWLFGDQGQAFWEERRIPSDGFFQATLKQSYRCPASLLAFAAIYRDAAQGQLPERVLLPEGIGEALSVIPIDGPDSRQAALSQVLEAMIADGVEPSQIAVLSLAGQTHSEICHLQSLGEIAVRRGDDEDAREHVICDTFLRFKGLERPFIVLTELDCVSSRYDRRMHIALTRALVHAIIVAHPGELDADPRLRALSN